MQVISRLVNMESPILRMVQSVLACSSFAGGSMRCSLGASSRGFAGGVGHYSHTVNKGGRGFCTVPNNVATPVAQDNEGTASPPPPPPPQPQQQSFSDDTDTYSMNTNFRRRPYNLEAKMRMKQYRREAMMQSRQQELEEEQRTFQLDYTTIYKKGDPGTCQGVIKEIISLGYIVTLPNGREGLLAAAHLGCSGGLPLLERLFKVGQEIAIRVIPVPNPAGKDRVYVRA